jgi:hypothetical protein
LSFFKTPQEEEEEKNKKNNNRVFSETETEHEMSQTLELWGLCNNRKQKHIFIYK